MAGKKITQLNSGSLSNLPLSGVTAVVYSGLTLQHTLSDLRLKLVDSGSHVFTGSQVINGNLTVSGSITAQQYILSSSITNITTETISGSSNFGNSSDDKHTFNGSVNVTGSLLISGSSTYDIDVVGSIRTSGPNTTILVSGSNGKSFIGQHDIYIESTSVSPYLSTEFGGNVGVYNMSNLTEIGIALDGTEFSDNWSNGPVLYVNNTSGNTYDAVFGFQNKTGYTDGRITLLKNTDLSGSLNVTNGITGSINFNNLINVPPLVSGSSQISYTGITNIPNGIVSGSSQILVGSGVWSGSSQLPSGVVSGSSQISYTGITNIPNGLISGSSQISNLGYTTTGSNQFNGNQTITGSLIHGNAGNIAIGEQSHVEGESTQAIGNFSHAEGLGTIAYGNYSHAEGQDTIASGSHSHTEGNQTIALADHQHVQGKYNITSSVPAAFIVGNGTDAENRSNLIHAAGNEVQITGSLSVSGSLMISGSGSLNGSNIVSSNTIQKIETISSASYAALTPPVSGTLYIII